MSYSPSFSVVSYRREHSSRLNFKAQFGSADIHVGQEDAQAHFGSFQSSTKLILFWGIVVEAMAHLMWVHLLQQHQERVL